MRRSILEAGQQRRKQSPWSSIVSAKQYEAWGSMVVLGNVETSGGCPWWDALSGVFIHWNLSSRRSGYSKCRYALEKSYCSWEKWGEQGPLQAGKQFCVCWQEGFSRDGAGEGRQSRGRTRKVKGQ